MRRRAFLLGAASVSAVSARAEISIQAKTTIRNAKAISGDRFTANGKTYQLANVIAPSLYTFDSASSPFFVQARDLLQEQLGRAIGVVETGKPTRWGVRIVDAYEEGGAQTLQEVLCLTGAIRVAPSTDDKLQITRLLAAEQKARDERRGLWALEEYQVFPADDSFGAVGAYHLIEGPVVRAAKTKSRFFLNFGADYKTDFTAGVVNRLYRRWAKENFDLAALEGAMVRIRGMVEEINGPSIDLKHQAQIELLTNSD